MILDTSALMAILLDEPEAPDFLALMQTSERLGIAAPTALELALQTATGEPTRVNRWLADLGVRIVPFDEAQLHLAQEAHVRYGRGSGSAARLNYGDCMSYALAKVTGEPLLFKGDDFTHTDVTPAV